LRPLGPQNPFLFQPRIMGHRPGKLKVKIKDM
jgi:hypothetical protein